MISSRPHLKRTTSVIITALLVVGIVWTQGSAQTTEVSMGGVFVNARVAPLWIAEKEGFFRKNGIDIKISNIPGGTQGAQALLAGGIDISFTDPASTLCALAAGVPVRAA